MLQDTKNLLQKLQPMIECAYLNGFNFNESFSPRQNAKDLIKELQELIESECIIARRRGIISEMAFQDQTD
jgi:hypothetical protein